MDWVVGPGISPKSKNCALPGWRLWSKARLEIVEQGIVFIVEVLLGLEGIPHTSTLLLFNLVAKMNAKEGGIDCVLVALLQRLEAQVPCHGVQIA